MMTLSQERQLSLSYSTSADISTVCLRMNAYTLIADPNRQFLRPRIFLGRGEGLASFAVGNTGSPDSEILLPGVLQTPDTASKPTSLFRSTVCQQRGPAEVPLTNGLNDYPRGTLNTHPSTPV